MDNLLSNTVHLIPAPAIAVNSELKIIFANKRFYSTVDNLGFEPGEATNLSLLINDKKQYKSLINSIWNHDANESSNFELFFHANHQEVIFEIDAGPEILFQDKIIRILILKERTESFTLLKQLRKNDKKYLELVSSMPDILLMNDKTGDFLFYINPLQFNTEDGFLKVNAELDQLPIPEKIKKMTIEAFERFKKTGEPQTLKSFIENDQGELRIYESRVTVDSEDRLVSISRDVTDQKLLEIKIEESERRLRLALESNNDGIFDWNIHQDKVYFSTSWKEMLGYSDDEIENAFSSWERLVHPDDLDRTWEELMLHLRGKTQVYTTEFRMQTKQGAYKWVMARGKVIERDGQGRALRLIGTHTDINSLKSFEKELVEKNKQLEEFAFIATHRLRRPVANLRGLLNEYEATEELVNSTAAFKQIKESVKELDYEIMSLGRSIQLSKVEQVIEDEKEEKQKIVFLIDDDHINNKLNERIIARLKLNVHTFKNVHEPMGFIMRGISKPDLIIIDVHMEADNGWRLIDEIDKSDLQIEIIVLTTIINSADVERFRKYLKVKDVWLKPLSSAMIKQYFKL